MPRHTAQQVTTSDGMPAKSPRKFQRSMWGFLLRFLVLIMAFYALAMTPWFREKVFPANLRANAFVSAMVLAALGEEASARGMVVMSPRFALEVRRGCEGLEPAALFCAAVLAFPASWRTRFAGVALGVALLNLMNLVRIATLFYAGVHVPSLFDWLHVEVWQTVFFVFTMALWLAWAWRASRPDVERIT